MREQWLQLPILARVEMQQSWTRLSRQKVNLNGTKGSFSACVNMFRLEMASLHLGSKSCFSVKTVNILCWPSCIITVSSAVIHETGKTFFMNICTSLCGSPTSRRYTVCTAILIRNDRNCYSAQSHCRCGWEHHYWNSGQKEQWAETANQRGLPAGQWQGKEDCTHMVTWRWKSL